MADSQYTDPRIYGGTPMAAPTQDSAAPAVQPSAEPERRDIRTDGLQSAAQGEAAMQEASRPEASFSRTIEAAAFTWSGTRALRAMLQPSFPPDQEYNPAADMKAITGRLSMDEEKWLLESTSNDEFRYRLNELDKLRIAQRDIGDNPVIGTIATMLDPGYIAVDLATLGVSRVARLGRAATGLTAAAGTAALDLSTTSQAPVTVGDMVANALLNGAASGMFLNTAGKLERKAQDYPEAELAAAAKVSEPIGAGPAGRWVQRTDADGNPVFSASGKPVYARETTDTVMGATKREADQVNKVVDEVGAYQAPPSAAPQYRGSSGALYKALTSNQLFQHVAQYGDRLAAPLAKALQERIGPMLDNLKVYVLSDADLASTGKRAHYNATQHAVYVSHSTSPQIMLHEVAHAATVDKIKYGRANPGTAHAEVVQELEGLRKSALAQAEAKGLADSDVRYLTKNVEEFVAGLFTGDTNLTKTLASMADPGGRSKNLLSRLVDAVRRVLGFSVDEGTALARALQLTDELLDAPLVKGAAGLYQAPPSAAAVGRHMDDLARRTGDAVAWNTHKTLARWNERVADTLVDNPLDPSGRSVEAHQRAIRAELTTLQIRYDDMLLRAMADEGIGLRQRILGSRRAVEVQARIERQVAQEMLAREDAARRGIPRTSQAPESVQRMADALQEVADAALDEMRRSGVRGAERINARAGYFSRKWSSANLEHALQRMETLGIDRAAGRSRLVTMMAGALRRANGWDTQLSQDVAGAIIDRTLRKGEFSDSAFRAHIGNEGLAEVRDILTNSGIRGDRLQRAMDVLAGVVDEAGKAPILKHRVDMDMSTTARLPDGSVIQLSDLLDTNLSTITDRYLDTVSGQAAFARTGLYGPTDIGRLRTELVSSIANAEDRAEAVRLFDNITAYLMGRPVGDDMVRGMRKLQAVTQMVGLASSGLWQVTEYATAMGRYGVLKTLRYALAHMPGFRGLFTDIQANRDVAGHLQNVLARHSFQDVRMRPFIQRLEDNYEFPISDQVLVGLQQAKQLVPYLNAMKYVHHHQAQVVANLVTDTLERAARGNADAVRMLEQYGLDAETLARVREDITRGGLDTAQWSDATWDAVRPALSKMMDESVLRNRVGDIPAFAQFSAVGKFIFTFRSFVLGAHNKLLAGGLARDGFIGVGLVALYQFPLAALAVTMDNTIKGKDALTPEEAAARAVSQMGIMGLFSDVWGIASGQKTQFGAPGLMVIDRSAALLGHTAQGEFGHAASDLLNTLPLLPLIPGIKAIGENLK